MNLSVQTETYDETDCNVYAIVVCYHPDSTLLHTLLTALLPQISHAVLVNNGPPFGLSPEFPLHKLTLIQLNSNIGVATALNKGITMAIAAGATYILSFDQDSIPSDTMVAHLVAAAQKLRRQGENIAAVGPLLIDRRSRSRTPFVRIKWHGITRNYCSGSASQIHPTDFLVTSGMLVPTPVFSSVGLPEEGLFIDNIDMEWCFRARSMGYALYGVCDAVMQHSVGDHVYRLGPFSLYRHNPVRQYYIMRNRLWLYSRCYTPASWIFQDAIRALFKVFVFSFVFAPRIKNIQMIYRGVRDAITGRLGKYAA